MLSLYFWKSSKLSMCLDLKNNILPLHTEQMTVKASGVIFSCQIFLLHNLIPLLIEKKPVHKGLPFKMNIFSF